MRFDRDLLVSVALAAGVFAAGVAGIAVNATAGAPRTINVILKDDRLPPGAIRARPGDRIIFRNTDEHAHVANIEEPDHRFIDKEIEAGTSAMFVIPLTMEPGEYRLNCSSHEGMATIVIEAE